MKFEKRKEEILENGDKVIYCSYKEALEIKTKNPKAIIELKDYIEKDNIYEMEQLVCIIPEEYPRITEGFWDYDEHVNCSPGLRNYVFNQDDGTQFHEQHMGGGYDEEYNFIKGINDLETCIGPWFTGKINSKNITGLPLCIKTTVTIKKEEV